MKFLLLAGKSGSGKSTVADILSLKYGYKSINSYTTRPKRSEIEMGHIFIDDKDFEKIRPEDMVAYTKFNGNRYCATKQQVEDSDIYIIDKAGIKFFNKKYDGDKEVVTIYLDAPERTCIRRMIARGDNINAALERAEHDAEAFLGIEALCDVIIQAENTSAEKIADFIALFLKD